MFNGWIVQPYSGKGQWLPNLKHNITFVAATKQLYEMFRPSVRLFAIVIQWIYFTIWKKIKKNHHHYNAILSLYNIISRHYKKSLIRSQIYHGYEELSTDTNYPIWRRQEKRSKYAVQLASWQLRSNSPKTSVHPSVRPSVRLSVTPKKIVDFDPNWAFPDCNSSMKSSMATKWCTKLEVA